LHQEKVKDSNTIVAFQPDLSLFSFAAPAPWQALVLRLLGPLLAASACTKDKKIKTKI